MKMRLWAQIGLALAVNLVGVGVIVQQGRGGVNSLLQGPAREKVREWGTRAEGMFPGLTAGRRTELLAEWGREEGVELALYEDTGEVAAGPDLRAPKEVLEQVERPGRRPLFLVRDGGRYWYGVQIPMREREDRPPVRHTLVAVTDSLLTFVEWRPWAAGLGMALLVTVLCWAPLIRRLTRSIEAMRVAAGEIAEGRFEAKVPVGGGDELGELGGSIERMAGQLSQLVHGQRRFLADVAHELCAPLARIQLSMGILEQRMPDSEHLQRLERDVAHMSALVGDLLLFTKGAVREAALQPLGLAGVVREVVAQEHAEDVVVAVEEGLRVMADGEYLRRALGNVVRNAKVYAGEAGPIVIQAERVNERVRLTVEDSGPGLPEAELERVFTAFYRADAARTPGAGGAGLGLAIVKSAVTACGGTVWCRNRKPRGLAVGIELGVG